MSSNSPPVTAVEAGSHPIGFSLPSKDIISADAAGVVVSLVDAAVIVLGSWLGQSMDAVDRLKQAADWDAVLGVALFAGMLLALSNRLAGLTTLPSLLHPDRTVKRNLAVCSVVVMALAALLVIPKLGAIVPRGSLIGMAAAMLVACGLGRVAGVWSIFDVSRL